MPRVRIAVQAGNIARHDADVIALKYADGLTGASRQIASALGISPDDLKRAMPSRGDMHVVAGAGRIKARHAAFLHVAPLHEFTYDHVRQFSVDVLGGLQARLPMTRHLGLTMHGVLFGMDYQRSLAAEISGCTEAIAAGACPDALDRITVVERSFRIEPLQQTLRELLPDGAVEMPYAHVAKPTKTDVSPAAGSDARFDVFLSFKSEDADHAQQVYEFLGSHGLRVFFSRESLPRLGSDEYHKQIDAAIDQARHMVVVASAHDHAMSRWVQYEWRLFLGEVNAGLKAGNLIPIVAGGMRIADLPIALRNREVVQLTREDLPRLINYVRSDDDRFDRVRAAAPQSSSLKGIAGLIVAAADSLENTSWSQATRHAASLVIEGHRGWRLPTLDELRVIRDASLVSARPCYWSSKEANRSEAFYMHFDDGHVGRGPKGFSNGLSAVFVKSRELS